LDEAEHSQVCVIGEAVRRELFGYEEAVGQVLKVNDLWLEVVGVLEGSGGASSAQGLAVGSTDSGIYLPVTSAIRKLNPIDALRWE
jgi:putative ABC transport system permease protein